MPVSMTETLCIPEIIPEFKLIESVKGSEVACVQMAQKLSNYAWATYPCLHLSLTALGHQFQAMSSVFKDMRDMLHHANFSLRANTTIRQAQQQCQVILNKIRDILLQFSDWDLVAPDHIHQQVQVLDWEMKIQRSELVLLFGVLDLVRTDDTTVLNDE